MIAGKCGPFVGVCKIDLATIRRRDTTSSIPDHHCPRASVEPTIAMLQNLAAEIVHCYERARQAREKAERALNDQFKADFLDAERRWMALAHSYERQQQLSRTVAEFARRRNAGAIVRMLREQEGAFDPDVVARLDIAYHAALDHLGLIDREDGMTLLIARRIIELATLGERDPERLVAGTIEALSK
jgi:hypothetical protein